MLTTTLSKPQSMSLGLPDKDEDPNKNKDIKVDEKRTMTIMMGENNKLVYYMGLLEAPIAGPKDIAYGKDGIRKELLSRKKSVLEYTGDKEKGIIVIIKPGKKSKYKNVVDILDEMAITGVGTYAIVNDFVPKETELLEAK